MKSVMSHKDIMSSEGVRELSKAFDLELPTEMLVVSKYEIVDGSIVISEIDVCDLTGKFKRKANITKVLPYMKSMYVKFN